MKTTTSRLLNKYFFAIALCADEKLSFVTLVEKSCKAKTLEDSEIVLRIKQSFNSSIIFLKYTEERKIMTIKNNLEILDFFEIKYPAPPKEITHLFKTEEPKSNPMKWQSGPNSFQKTNVEAILRDIPKQPKHFTDYATGVRDIPED